MCQWRLFRVNQPGCIKGGCRGRCRAVQLFQLQRNKVNNCTGVCWVLGSLPYRKGALLLKLGSPCKNEVISIGHSWAPNSLVLSLIFKTPWLSFHSLIFDYHLNKYGHNEGLLIISHKKPEDVILKDGIFLESPTNVQHSNPLSLKITQVVHRAPHLWARQSKAAHSTRACFTTTTLCSLFCAIWIHLSLKSGV